MIFELNGTLVIFVVSFLGFMMLLNEIMLKPVGRVIEERNLLIEGELGSGRESLVEAEQLQSQYEENLKRIRSEAQSVIAKASQQANNERSERLAGISNDGAKKLEAAQKEIADERAKLIDALVAEESELVEIITKKVLGDESVQVNIDAGEVRRTLEEAC